MPEDNPKSIGFEKPQGAISQKPKGNTYYLFIGIDHYHNQFTKDKQPVKNLNNPVHDVNLLMDCLIEHYQMPEMTTEFLKDTDERYKDTTSKSYNGTFISCLLNEAATKIAIIQWIEDLIVINKIGGNDSLLIYFSGHGVYKKLNKRFYLIPADGVKNQENSWLYLNDICDYFKAYQQDKRCRDLLMILDCCYAGSAQFGQGGNNISAYLSRKILTSSGDDEVAMDGVKGKGSPFVNCLVNVLTANSTPILSIKSIFSTLNKKLLAKTKDAQTLVYTLLPCDEHGKGEFEFYLKQKNKPRLDHLKESFIEHLNFQTQKGVLTSKFSKKANQINIISTFGSSFDSQKFLSKVLFKWIFKRRISYSKGHIPCEIEISQQGASDVGALLAQEFFDKPIDPAKQLNEITKYIIDTLVGNSDNQGCKHLLIWIGYKIGNDAWIDALQNFCLELKTDFLQKIALLEPTIYNRIGNLFIVLSDERAVDQPHSFDLLKTSHKKEYNLLLTPMIEPVNANHFDDWKEVTAPIIQVKIPDINEENIFFDGQTDADIKDFILQVCKFCNFNQKEKNNLYAMLYDYRNQLF